MRFVTLVIFALACNLLDGCNNKESGPPVVPNEVQFAKGADISWLSQMESEGRKFYNAAGIEQDCMLVLKNLGMNTVRLRVWVDPANGWNNKADVIAKAIRAKNLGMRIMINFHYSDTWADPGHQTKPAAWTSQDIDNLKTLLSSHTIEVLNDLKLNNITPGWVQVGNETNDGMLWPEGKASANMTNFALLVNAGYDAAKSVFPNTKVIVHLSNGFDNNLFRWLFDGLKTHNGKWDVIGMSLYPAPGNWSTLNTQCLNNMHDMVERYNKEVMIVEAGMSWDEPTACRSFLEDIIAKTKSLPSKKGLGVLYWEPQSYNNWQGYTLGAFDNSGEPTQALQAFNN